MVARRATAGTPVALLFLFAFSACGGSPPPDPTPTSTTETPTRTPIEDSFTATPPDRDLIDLAMRYRGLPEGTERLARDGPFDYGIGQAEEFHVFDLSDEPEVVSVSATLRHVTDHAYFFVQTGRRVSQETLDTIGRDFETIVYPTITEAFGQEWTPGVDSDPRLTLLHTDLQGAGGYVSGLNEFPATVVPLSNQREMIALHANILGSPGVPYNALVAHELQHLIHWHADSGEESWVNEGLSQVAAELVGSGSSRVSLYLSSPDVGLLDWPEIEQSSVHYAASQLFFTYLLDQYGGRENAAALLAEPFDSVRGVQGYLDGFSVQFIDVFANWLAATSIDAAEGVYAHVSADTSEVNRTTIGSPGSGKGSVSQFGADFLEIEATDGVATFTFNGAETAAPPAPVLDGPYYWSNQGDSIDSTMTVELDLSNLVSATLRFDAWHEIERGWDFAYVSVSRDDGETWEALAGSHTSDYDPVGQSYGAGYTGSSDGWFDESIDLSNYADETVLLRFEYVTDGSTNLAGFAVDNIEVPEIGFLASGHTPAGWDGEGFHVVGGPMAQEWLIQVIDRETDDVQRIELDDKNDATFDVSGPSTVVVAAVTEGPRGAGDYSWSLSASD